MAKVKPPYTHETETEKPSPVLRFLAIVILILGLLYMLSPYVILFLGGWSEFWNDVSKNIWENFPS
jgi:predicted membrane protein